MSTSNYALRMARLSNRIFGEVARPTAETSMRVVKMFSKKPLARDPFVTEYYPNHPQLTGLMIRLRNLGLYRDEHRDFRDEINRLKTLRGKGKPKKGEGKRASKK